MCEGVQVEGSWKFWYDQGEAHPIFWPHDQGDHVRGQDHDPARD